MGPVAPRGPPHHDRIVGVGDRQAAIGVVRPHAGLRRLVAGEVEVDVEVVRGEVQPRADDRPVGGGEGEAERRRLHHEHLGLRVVDGLDQRHVDVAGRHGPDT